MDVINTYYNEYNLPSASKLYKIMKNANEPITLKQVTTFINEQQEQQIHKKKKKKRGIPIVAGMKNMSYQADLLDFSKYGSKNKGYNWLLIVIDVLTRKAAGIPLKTKTSIETYNGLLLAFEDIGGTPIIITTDDGKEWNELSKDDELIHRRADVGDHNVLGMIDRLSKTIKDIIAKKMTKSQNEGWISSISNIIKAYNKSPHGALNNITPNDADENPSLARHVMIKKLDDAKGKHINDLIIGDHVRIKRKKGVFDKGYEATYSLKIFEIEGKEGNYYILNDGSKHRENSLLKVSKQTTITEKKDLPKIAKKIRKNEQFLKREHIENANVVEKKRDRKTHYKEGMIYE